jgi:hypothetical protein
MPTPQGLPDYAGYDSDYLATMIQGGVISIPHPETGEPVIGFSPEGMPITASMAHGMAGVSAVGNITVPNATVDPDQMIRDLTAANADGEAAAAQQQRAPINDPREDRFGHDMAWLDELFQQDPTNAITTAQSLGTTADPSAEAAQRALLQDVWGRGTTADPAAAAGQDALLADVRSRGVTADAQSEADQRALASEIAGRGTTADSQSEATQRGTIDELMGIYRQGGLTEVDRNRRAQARADVEGWLRGQREADMADMSERGMSGGGAELAALMGGQQAAASRLSAADLQTSADSEMRALEALMGGGDMAGRMRDQADQYQATNTTERGRLLESMRRSADDFTVANDQTARGILGDQRSASDAYRLDTTRIAGTLLGDMRSSADAYQQGNAQIIAGIEDRNKAYLRDSHDRMLERRDRWDRGLLDLQTGVARDTREHDAGENRTGYEYGYGVAGEDAQRVNSAQAAANQAPLNAFTGMTGDLRGAGGVVTGLTGNRQRSAGEGFSAGANVAGNIVSGVMGGGGGNMTGDTSRYGDDDDETNKGY